MLFKSGPWLALFLQHYLDVSKPLDGTPLLLINFTFVNKVLCTFCCILFTDQPLGWSLVRSRDAFNAKEFKRDIQTFVQHTAVFYLLFSLSLKIHFTNVKLVHSWNQTTRESSGCAWCEVALLPLNKMVQIYCSLRSFEVKYTPVPHNSDVWDQHYIEQCCTLH